MNTLDDLQRLLNEVADKLPEKALAVIEISGNNFIIENFKKGGFLDDGLEKWEPRKTVDKNGRDLTKYKTERAGRGRKGRVGKLTKFGKTNEGRGTLIGHNSGGDKLMLSFRAHRGNNQVAFRTYKKYARFHNEGINNMPKRKFIGHSRWLYKEYSRMLNKVIDKLINK